MKEYVKQIYNEGLGLTIYKPVEKRILKLKDSGIKRFLMYLYKGIYLVFAVIISIVLFLVTYPL